MGSFYLKVAEINPEGFACRPPARHFRARIDKLAGISAAALAQIE